MGLFSKSKGLIGLDIGSSAIKVVEMTERSKGFQLLNFGMAPLPPEAIVDGALMNANVISEAIGELVSSHKIKTKDAATAVSGHSVIIKKISLPSMTDEELEESIQWEAEQYIPFDINDVHIDVQRLSQGANDAGQMDVLLVAAKKDMINDYTAVISEAGLAPVVMDVAGFAVQNQFELNYEVVPGESVVLVNIGASIVNINILKGGITSFTRDVSMGGNQFTEEIQKQLNVSYEEAEALKLGGDMGSESQAVVPQEVEGIIASVSENLAAEIQRSLDFYAATAAEDHITKIWLSGGSAKVPGLTRVFEARTNIPVEVMNPFKNVTFNERQFKAEELAGYAPMAAVGVGLGMRRVGDR